MNNTAKKVLVIDDDVTFQKAMADKLSALGYQGLSSMDGEEGLNKAISERPDIILLDIKMPKMDGISFLKRLRADKTAPTMPILITSNLTSIEKISEGVALGVKGYIIKSNETLDTIIHEVEKILSPDKKTDTPITQVP